MRASRSAIFERLRFARADARPDLPGKLGQWLALGRHGEMGWMEETAARRADPLHQPAQHAEAEQLGEVAPVMRLLPGAEDHDHQHHWRDEVERHQRQRRDRPAECETEERAEHVAQREAPDDDEDEVELVAQQRRARLDAEDQHRAQEQRHRA